MVESIGRESYFPIINCASWLVFQCSLQELRARINEE